ncbi:MAG: hypothetical protein A2066_17615 [Bacteroidetes bacterium GWB2_41_8]|nr:MAG: hypothetical protein A2066_17615 [Bacteroidetes bacterium GWB2_41_8]
MVLMKTRIFPVCTLLFILLTIKSFGQFSASYYTSKQYSKIGVGFDFSTRFWGELRMYGSMPYNNAKPEVAVYYNFTNTEKHSIYAGIGGSPSSQYGIMIPIGFKINTSKILENTGLHIEIEPTYDGVKERSFLYTVVGFRYYFRNKE